jgi:hypothetical protein
MGCKPVHNTRENENENISLMYWLVGRACVFPNYACYPPLSRNANILHACKLFVFGRMLSCVSLITAVAVLASEKDCVYQGLWFRAQTLIHESTRPAGRR